MSTLQTKAPQPKSLYVSRESFRKVFQKLDQYQLTNRRWGRRVANRTREPRGAGVTVHRPLERTEIDHFTLDVYVVDDDGVPICRPYMTAIIDCYSRMILGYSLSLSTPSAMTILATLRHAISLKPPIQVDRQALGLSLDKLPLEQELNWEVAGIMSLVVMDNGADFQGLSVRTGLHELGIEVQFCPPQEPWYKGIIERYGRTFNQKLIHWLPGTTYGKVMRDKDYKAKDKASLTLDELRQRMELTFWSYNRKPHRGLGKRTPLEVWREGVAQWPILLPPSNSLRFEASLCLTVAEKTLHKYGIEYDCEKFNSDDLGALWNRMPAKSKVMIKVDPDDINFIYVIDPRSDEAFQVPNARPRSQKISWNMLKAVKERAKALGLDPAEHEAQLVEYISQAVRQTPGKKQKSSKQPPAQPVQKKPPEQAAYTPLQPRTKTEPQRETDPASFWG